MFEIYVPKWYKIYEKNSMSWVTVKDLLGVEQLKCWNGEDFTPVHVSNPGRHFAVDNLAVVDAVTSVGISGMITNVLSSSHWIPPWLNGITQTTKCDCQCTPFDSMSCAIKDFCREIYFPAAKNIFSFSLPLARLELVLQLFPTMKYQQVNNKFFTCSIQKNTSVMQLCESDKDSKCRENHMHYIEMVLALKGNIQKKRKDHNKHIQIIDHGLHISPHSFRRLRRMTSSCGILNRYGFRVFAGKNGKGRQQRRRVRLGITQMHNIACLNKEVKEKCTSYVEVLKSFGSSPRHAIQNVKILSNSQSISQNTEWLKISLQNSKCIVIEGIMLFFA